MAGPTLDGSEPTEQSPTGADPSGASDARPVDVLTVRAVRDVTPAVRRVTLTASPDVVASAGPTLSLLVPRVGDAAPHWPQVARDGRIVWPQGSHGVGGDGADVAGPQFRRQPAGSGHVVEALAARQVVEQLLREAAPVIIPGAEKKDGSGHHFRWAGDGVHVGHATGSATRC